MTLVSFPQAPQGAGHLTDPEAFHRRLAQWNHRRLDPTTPYEDGAADARADAQSS